MSKTNGINRMMENSRAGFRCLANMMQSRFWRDWRRLDPMNALDQNSNTVSN